MLFFKKDWPITTALVFILLLTVLCGCGTSGIHDETTAQDETQSDGAAADMETENIYCGIFPKKLIDLLSEPEIGGLRDVSDIATDPSSESDLRYYGTYHDCIVIFSGGNADVLAEITVAGYEFTHGQAFVIYVYSGGELYELPLAYEMGLLSEEDISAIYEVHRQFQ